MPSIAIGVADSHVRPADQWMETLRIKEKTIFPGAPDIVEHVLSSLVDSGFDVSRAGSTEYGNNLLMPWVLSKCFLLLFFLIFTFSDMPRLCCKKVSSLSDRFVL
jgi:2,3-dihydroxyphenylpropionate 1,2-dioxygenase